MKRFLYSSFFFLSIFLVSFSGVSAQSHNIIDKNPNEKTTEQSQQENQVITNTKDENSVYQEEIIIDVFVRDTCKHCKKEKEFLEKYNNDDSVNVVLHNLKDEQVYNDWKSFTEKYGISKITPITVIGNTIIQGFDTAETTGGIIESAIEQARHKEKIYTYDEYISSFVDLKEIGDGQGVCAEDSTECAATEANYIFTVPFLGVIDLYNYSLPSISFILGLIDGFNPCAMWVLVTFLLVLVQVGNKRRMWEIAGLFIVAEAVMYYLILTVWFTAWDFIGLDAIVTPIVGIVAIGGGLFFLWEWKNTDGTCQVTDYEQRGKISRKIHKIAESKMGIATILAIIGLALSVNVIEFACSVGIPQAYTKIIEMNMLSALETHLNMLIYIIAYMIDDFIVFGIALYGIDKLHLTSKYSKASNLIGGILMIILGIILIFARELLVF